MASGFFAVLDDIAVLLDDVAMMSKVAAKKTAGILGDDLAVNAEKASGFASSRELPVLWAITKGSLLNKLIILPIVFLLSAFLPIAIKILLILGGIYLSFEGAEKIYEWIFPHPKSKEIQTVENEADILALEKTRVKDAIFTDFILSLEIIIIALNANESTDLLNQILTVSFIAVIATIGVYGIVALIVRMDEAGYHLVKKSKSEKSLKAKFGNILINALPYVIKGLTIVGTIALLTVSGNIFLHNIEFLHHFLETLPGILRELLIGLLGGIVAVILFNIFLKIKSVLVKS
ncbi:DUF808 domain-containing protein [Frigoriflavimonas asaccharolytica]|uniref:DUF808 domain-containing protein n=1 Tax=Frigoriflavimonas asaccharolytica TaxID=2735899 RepID=A0A8J8K975_9FLAO|nr:DUF808 domain-containing protein [Frigoriflavimonas asaccharolytica]NRS92777.1 hypothetical protein [Frigoriflavimonas asaccharolytica]